MACRLNRLIRIIRLVRMRAFPTVEDLCSKFDIKERTLFNDLKELREDLGVDIQFEKTRRGYYVASDIAELNFITLNEESAFLLLAAMRLLKAHGGEDLAAPLRSSFDDELQYWLSSESGENKLAVSAIVEADTLEKLDKTLFVDICRACLKQQPMRIILETEKTEKRIVPSCLVYTADGWKLRYINLYDSNQACLISLSLIGSAELIAAENN